MKFLAKKESFSTADVKICPWKIDYYEKDYYDR